MKKVIVVTGASQRFRCGLRHEPLAKAGHIVVRKHARHRRSQ